MTGCLLGLKGAIENNQFLNRINQPDIAVFEFHLNEDDLFGVKLQHLKEKIELMQSINVKVFLHHPMTIHGEYLHVNNIDSKTAEYFLLSTRILVEICEEFDIYVVVHVNYGNAVTGNELIADKDSVIKTVSRMLMIDEKYGKGRILWENGIAGVGAYRKDFYLADAIAGTSLKLCFDISHAFISLNGDNDRLVQLMAYLEPNIVYYHVVDSMGETHDSLMIGDGRINFHQLHPFIFAKDYIYEIGLSDLDNCKEMLVSHARLKSIMYESKR